MKSVKVLAVAVVAMATLSNPAYANTAKYQKIDRVFKKCFREAQASAPANNCIENAVNGYVKLFNKSQKARFQKADKQCIAKHQGIQPDGLPYSDTGYQREAFLLCQYDAVKAIAKRK
ncbi:hypothetical protein [Moraxella pluranimalium]|nr:hypothetical protein [Moraxella pluranimalium]